jgi:alpha-glucuronidase
MRCSSIWQKSVAGFALLLAAVGVSARGEDGSAAWLRYAPISHPEMYKDLPSRIVVDGDSAPDHMAGIELQRGLTSLLGRNFALEENRPIHTVSDVRLPDNAIVIRSFEWAQHHITADRVGPPPGPESYFISWDEQSRRLFIDGEHPTGDLYAAFHLLEEVAAQQPVPQTYRSTPSAPIRWTDEWDNLNGTIERGYAGPSIFFENGHVSHDLTRAGEYARLLSSVGINGCNINNVNADLDLLTTEHIKEFARIADVFRPWGVKLALSIDLTSPQTVGGLDTFDPLDPKVIAWWQQKVDEIYTLIPDFGGFTVKADSEGRKGPSQYGRTPAEAANVLARALAPHHGVVLYRGFVYNNHLDWHDLKADRARAGVDNFASLDGKFEKNVIIQIKEGPIDFQAREPVSPLFAALRHTPQAIEVQTSQEYTGQQRHMVWLPSMWQWVLDTDMRVDGKHSPVKEIITGKTFNQPTGGFVSVVNVGMEPNWLHHPMAMANLYGYGKLAWNPDESLEKIIDTWTRLTWGNDPQVDRTIDAMQLGSWNVYESYTGPNGVGTLTNILGYHFGPGIESAERNGWGQWFRGEKDGIGMDRTVATGTGYIGQYPKELAEKYESLATCPDDLLLFFHHVPYDYKLHSGKALVQSIYDAHYDGALAAAEYVPQWESLKDKIDPERYEKTHALFEYQAGHAIVWRDAINNWFHQISGIDDVQGRVGHHPNRIEAESMKTGGYQTVDVVPWETGSGGKAVECHAVKGCTLTTTLERPAGRYDVAVQYFDIWHGVSTYTLSVNGAPIATWKADDTLPPAQPDSHLDGQTSTRRTIHHVALKSGDVLELRGVPDLRLELFHGAQASGLTGAQGLRMEPNLQEYAPVDYIELGPDGPITPQ